MSIITPEDFDNGVYKISQDTYTTANLQKYIDQWEAAYLNKLFGVSLKILFDEDLNDDEEPVTARFVSVFEPFVLQDDGSGSIFYPIGYTGGPDVCSTQPSIHESYGIKDMLCGFIYFLFMRDADLAATPMGNQQPEVEVSTKATAGRTIARLRESYNRAIDSFTAIQWYMKLGPNAADYPEFNGLPLRKMFMGGSI